MTRTRHRRPRSGASPATVGVTLGLLWSPIPSVCFVIIVVTAAFSLAAYTKARVKPAVPVSASNVSPEGALV